MFIRKLFPFKFFFGKTSKVQMFSAQKLSKNALAFPSLLKSFSNKSSKTVPLSYFQILQFTFSSTKSAPTRFCQSSCVEDFNQFKEEFPQEHSEEILRCLTVYSNCQDIPTLSNNVARNLIEVFATFGGLHSGTNFFTASQYLEESIRLSEMFGGENLVQDYLNRNFLSFQYDQVDDMEIWIQKAEDALRKQANNSPEITAELELGMNIGRFFTFSKTKKLDEALRLFEELSAQSEFLLQTDYGPHLPLILKEAATIYFLRGENPRAVALIKKAADLDTEYEYEQSAYKILFLAETLVRYDEYSEAELFAKKAKKRFSEFLSETSWEVAWSQGILGNIYEQLGDIDNSLLNYENAMYILEQYHPKRITNLEQIYFGIARVYFLKHKDLELRKAFEKYLALRKGSENLSLIKDIYDFCFLIKDRDSTRKDAQRFLEIALEIHKNLKERDPKQELSLVFLYGEILINEGLSEVADKVLDATEQLIENIPALNPMNAGEIYLTRGEVALKLGDLGKSIDLLEKAVNFPGMNEPIIKIYAYHAISQVYEKLNQPERGLIALLSSMDVLISEYGKTDTKTIGFFHMIMGYLEKYQMTNKIDELKIKYEMI